MDSPWAYPSLLGAGAVEGALLGAAQVLAVRAQVARLRGTRWIVFTALAAVFAYAIGMLPSTFAAWWTAWPLMLQIVLFAVLGTVLLGSIGFAQWIELRHHVEKSWWWIIGTALGWLAGLGIFFATAPPLWNEGQPLVLSIMIGIVAGLMMAIAMASVTGATMVAIHRGKSSASE